MLRTARLGPVCEHQKFFFNGIRKTVTALRTPQWNRLPGNQCSHPWVHLYKDYSLVRQAAEKIPHRKRLSWIKHPPKAFPNGHILFFFEVMEYGTHLRINDGSTCYKARSF
jgi:hypothetical protein